MNTIGLIAALSAFLGIWFGHVTVRKLEFHSLTLWLPAAGFIAAGVSLEWISLVTSSTGVSTAMGILGITLLWDSLELFRQQRRVRKGHAPANPQNPRHAAILAAPGSRATGVDMLKREPTGESLSEPAGTIRSHQARI